MSRTYRAFIEFEFEEGDLEDLAENLGVPVSTLTRDILSTVYAELDNLTFGHAVVTDIHRD